MLTSAQTLENPTSTFDSVIGNVTTMAGNVTGNDTVMVDDVNTSVLGDSWPTEMTALESATSYGEPFLNSSQGGCQL